MKNTYVELHIVIWNEMELFATKLNYLKLNEWKGMF